MESLTVCITSFRRAGYLRRAIQSCKDAGITRIVVAAMEPDEEVYATLEYGKSLGWTRFYVTPSTPDLGCNELWARAAYYADTDRVIILHDDDILLPDFGKTYLELIKPALERGVGFASWRAHVHRDDGRVSPTEYFGGPTTVHPSHVLEKFLLRKGRLSLSPVVSVLHRQTLINALKEADQVLVDKCSYLHPGMLLGTEILVYLRHCSVFPRWLYVDQLLSGYGAHAGSGTVQAEMNREIPKLAQGYDVARQYYETHRQPPTSHEQRILLMYSPYEPKSDEERERLTNARFTWQHHFDLNQIMELPVPNNALPRSSMEVGDEAAMPFLRDMLDYGCKFAMPNDIVAFANSDLCLTTNAHEEIKKGVAQGNGVSVAWRRTMKFQPKRLLATAKNGKWDGGVDLIAVTPEWWSCHQILMPDMIVAREAWDWVARVYAEKYSNHKCYIDNHFYHYPHPSMLSRVGWKNNGQLYNLHLAKKYFGAIGDHRAVKMLVANERNAARQ